MAITTSIISELSFKFREDDSYLNQENWQEYFNSVIPSGYVNHVCSFDYSTSKLTINTLKGIINGLAVEIEGAEYEATVGDDVVLFIALDLNDNKVKLYEHTDTMGHLISMVAKIREYISSDMVGLDAYMDAQCFSSARNLHSSFLPIAWGTRWGSPNRSYFVDLAKLIVKSGESFSYKTTAEGTGTIQTQIQCGQIFEYGLAQIYGGHNYSITIESTYAEDEYLLVPIPACSMDAATVRIKNNSGSQITVKIPKRNAYQSASNYYDYNEFVFDATWIDDNEANGYISYLLPDDSDILITIRQTDQYSQIQGSYYYSHSVFLVAQNVKNEDSGESYTKAEANSIFMTKSEGNLKADVTRSSYQLYVDGVNGDDNNDGSSGNPVKTIAKAVELANITNATRVTINIAAGTYAEDISITRQPTMVAFNATGGTVSVQYISIQYAEVILTGEFSASNRCTMMTAKLIINGNLTVAGDIYLWMGSTFICGGNLTINNPGGEGISVGGGSFAFVFSQYPTAAVINAKNALVADNGIICYSTITGTYTTLETTSRGGRIFTGSQS